MKFVRILPLFAAKLKMESAELDSRNCITFAVDKTWNVTFRVDDADNSVTLSMLVPTVNLDYLVHLPFLGLLHQRFSHESAKCGGFAVGFSEEDECIVLWRRYRDNFNGYEEVAGILSKLLEVADSLVADLPVMRKEAQRIEEETDAPEIPIDDMRSRIEMMHQFI